MKNSKNFVNLVFWSFVAPPGLSPDQIGHSKQKTGTLSFDTPKYMKIPNSQSWIHPISCTSPQMGSHQKFHSLNKLISKKFFSKIKILTHPYKSYVTIKNMFSHQISHIIMYSPLFWVPGVTLLRLLRCTNMLHFASSKEHSAWLKSYVIKNRESIDIIVILHFYENSTSCWYEDWSQL